MQESLFDLSHTLAKNEWIDNRYADMIAAIPHILSRLIPIVSESYIQFSKDVWIHPSAVIAKSVHIQPPCMIGAETEIRHCAFIRGNVLIGDRCVIGNSTEIKNSILFDNVQAPHFNYIGDSLLGFCCHLGAGVKTANLRFDKQDILVDHQPSSLRKCGVIMGDGAQIGCNSVTAPGIIIGKGAIVYPCLFVKRNVAENEIYRG